MRLNEDGTLAEAYAQDDHGEQWGSLPVEEPTISADEVLQTITAVASAVDDNEQARLDVIQRLAAWTSAHETPLSELLDEAQALCARSSPSMRM